MWQMSPVMFKLSPQPCQAQLWFLLITILCSVPVSVPQWKYFVSVSCNADVGGDIGISPPCCSQLSNYLLNVCLWLSRCSDGLFDYNYSQIFTSKQTNWHQNTKQVGAPSCYPANMYSKCSNYNRYIHIDKSIFINLYINPRYGCNDFYISTFFVFL